MPNSPVALSTINVLAVCGQFRNERLMAPDAVVLHDSQTAGLDLDRLVKILKRKALAVPQAMLDLDQILAYKIVRHVAIVARRRRVVRALSPAVVLIAHDMAIHARSRVVRQVAQPLGIVEREHAHAEHHTRSRGQKRTKSQEPRTNGSSFPNADFWHHVTCS